MTKALHKSINYDQFKFIEKNRSINKSHLLKLINKIQIENLTYVNPIIVDKDMNIIDGQHRFLACKELNFPFYYVIDDDYNENKMVMLNTDKLNWSLDDWIHLYCESNKQEYISLKNFLDKYKLPISLALAWLDLKEIDLNRSSLKDGSFVFYMNKMTQSSLDLTMELIDYLKNNNFKPQRIYRQKPFHVACKKFFSSEPVDAKYFFERLSMQPIRIAYSLTWQQYFDSLVEIYNFHSKKRKLSVMQQGHDRILV